NPNFSCLLPAADRDFFFFYISSKKKFIGIKFQQPLYKFRLILYCNTSDGGERSPGIKNDLHVPFAFYSPPEIDYQCSFACNGFQYLPIFYCTGFCSVQVHKMKPV